MQNLKNVKTNSFIAEGTLLEGDLTAEGGIRIDGHLKGNLQCDSVVFVGEQGAVKGNITAEGVVSSGRIKGDLTTTEQVMLHNPATLHGKVVTRQLVLEKGVRFDGACQLLEETKP